MKNSSRPLSGIDRLCLGLDQALRTLTGQTVHSQRAYPGKSQQDAHLSLSESREVAGFMRVNHAGEVAAQALYHAQAFMTDNQDLRQHLEQAALEEGDHLVWCEQRLKELGTHTSYLNPIWYTGSFMIGLLAGAFGDEWSLGFVAETETQVVKHLEAYLDKLPEADLKSHAILQQMQADEGKHRDEALASGAKNLPGFIKQAMRFTSKIMVKTAYWL